MGWFVFVSLVYAVAVVVVMWTAGAIFFDVGRASMTGGVLAVAWVVLALGGVLFWHPLWKPIGTLFLLFVFFLWWWFSQRPSHHRQWDANFSQLPRVALEGDTLTIENIRNTEYRTIDDNTPRYETRGLAFLSCEVSMC